jgi:Capsule assembly protein Wzi
MRVFWIYVLLVLGVSASYAGDGSAYVPLGNWMYPALERLAALGYVPSQPSNMGPWTRSECKRQIEEAAAQLADQDRRGIHTSEYLAAERLISDLEGEFAEEPVSHTELRIESLYTRLGGITGNPVNDSYHFGQSITNDFGRPYGDGFNALAGFSAYARTGRFFGYVRGEYEQAPGRADYGSAVDEFIAGQDANPVQGSAVAATHRFEPLEMYVGAQLGFENVTFGKQALWWGPGAESAFAFSDNAAPFYMVRFQQSRPFHVTRFAQFRTEFLFGELSGHHWPAQPYINAQKISIDLPFDLELGFTRSALFGGAGHPLTWGSFKSSLVSTFSPMTGVDPGDRHSGFDFRWRIPGAKRWLTLYSDSYADDDPNPLDNPKRSAWAPGLYISHLPRAPHMDLRFETYATWLYRKDQGPQFLYFNDVYHDSYTNRGSLLGSWIGRDSRAYVAATSYSLSAKTRVEAKYRQIKAANLYLPGGGTQTDFSVAGQWAARPEWLFSAQLQAERYWLPVLGPARHDVLASLQLTYYPRNWAWRP